MTKAKSKAKSAGKKAPAKKKGFSLIPDEKLIALYAAMLRCRMIEERMQSHFSKRPLAGRESLAGHEAAIAGVAIDLLPEDAIGPSACAPAANFVKGMALEKALRPLFGPQGNRNSSTQMGLGSELETGIALGLALASKRQKNSKVAVTFRGSEPAQGECWHQALHFAGSNRLPILFVTQGSAAADGTQEVHGIPRIAVDGSDVVAVYRVACEAITHARKGNGPTLIECVPYGLDSHLASSSPDARESEEPEGLIDKDPILNMEKYLAGKGLFAKNLRSKITASVRKELAAAIKAARKRLPV